ncbi:amidase [Aneurinibacillus sp. REN35]|uniref:amidase n=1 Tax=Aneurinibacillus sp. REN35 TaxID=3237286 RepID=UPI003526D29A
MASVPFQLMEATIDSIHAAIRSGEMTCKQLVEMYLARIEAYDKNGPAINSIITINSNVVKEAQEMDEHFQLTGEFAGALHGIPILVKDQAETKGITTTFGSVAFKDYVPEEDATAIKKLREAGAIILGKTTLPDFATSWFAFSSAAGETKNPYDLSRDPGGSSSGTAAAIAANLGAVGIGEDTGGSIRLPASFTNLFGVRVTTGLISRTGMSPLVHFQDTPGPMTRSVRDAAILLDVLVGYDPADSFTAAAYQGGNAGNYAKQLTADGLQGARIGILREAFGSDSHTESAQVNQVVQQAIEKMEAAGAHIIDPISVPQLTDYIGASAMYLLQSKHDFNEFLASKPGGKTVEELYNSQQYHELLDLFKDIAGGPDHPEQDPEYYKGMLAQEQFRRAIVNVMASHQLDAILFPTVQLLPPTKSELYEEKWTVLSFPTNTLIASQTGLPSISMPAGFTEKGIPVGVEMISKQFNETTLLKLAHAYEIAAQPRRVPASTPTLEEISK